MLQLQASSGVKVFPVMVSISMAAAVGPQPALPMVELSPETRYGLFFHRASVCR